MYHRDRSPFLRIIKSPRPFFCAPLVGFCWFFALYWTLLPLPPIYSAELRYTPLNSNCSPLPCSERVWEANCIVYSCNKRLYRSEAEYIGESGEGGKRNMKRAWREKIYEKSMRIVYAVCIFYVEVKCSLFSYSESTNRWRSKFPKGFDCDATKINYA